MRTLKDYRKVTKKVLTLNLNSIGTMVFNDAMVVINAHIVSTLPDETVLSRKAEEELSKIEGVVKENI